jgi:signal transduction histidine kinase
MEMESEIGWLIGLGSLVTFLLILAVVLFTVKYQRKVQFNELVLRDLENRRQREAFTIAIEAEERQKERISANLHDSITPELTILRRDLESSSRGSGTELNGRVGEWIATLDNCLAGIREVSHDLSPKTLSHFGLLKAIEHLAIRISETKAAKTSFTAQMEAGAAEDALKDVQLGIYRIAQELFQNILKHSAAEEICVKAEARKECFALSISHDGRGVEAGELDTLRRKGLGLSSIESRLLLMNGTIRFWRDASRFHTVVEIPLRSEAGIKRVFHP